MLMGEGHGRYTGLIRFIIHLFPEDLRRIVTRALGALMLMGAVFFVFLYLTGKEVDYQKKFHEAKEGSVRVSMEDKNPAVPTATPVGDLAYADRLLQEAARKWEEKDYETSIKLAEKAIDIRTRILGDDHVKVIEAKLQLTKAKQELLGRQLGPGRN